MLCLLKSQVEKIQQDFKDKGEVFRPSDYLNLDGNQITEKLRPIVGNNAEGLSELIQQKLILKNRIRGIELLRDKINEMGKYSPGRVEGAKEDIAQYKQKNLERVMSPKEHQNFLSSLAGRIVGTDLTREQAKTVFDQSKNIEDLKVEAAKNPKYMQGTTVELEKAKQELGKYINSLANDSQTKLIFNDAAKIYRDAFIGVKTGVKTTAIGGMNVGIDFLTRRLTNLDTIGKGVDLSLKTQFIKDNMEIGIKTGENSALNDGENSFGALDYSKGNAIDLSSRKGASKVTGMAAKAAEIVAIDVLHRAPMLVNSSLNMADALDKWSASASKVTGEKVNDVFKDAARVNPETETGKIVRNRAQQEVFRALSINDTWLSRGALKIKSLLNTGGTHIGDYILPMAKVPSNVIANQLENFGGGIYTGPKEIWQGMKELKTLKESGKAGTADGVSAIFKIRNGTQTLMRTTGVMLTAYLITMGLQKKDYKSDQYGNYYLHVNGHWISTQAFGPASIAIDGMADAKTGNTGAVWDYAKAGLTGASQAPVVSDMSSTAQNLIKQKSLQGAFGAALGNFYNPIIAQDIKKAQDEKSLNPVLFGTMIRTDAQMKQEDRAAQKKSVQSRIQNAKEKRKSQSVF